MNTKRNVNDKYIIHGPEPVISVSNQSLGMQLYQSLIKNKQVPVALKDALTEDKRSYEEILRKSCQLAESLKKYGLQRNDVIAIFSGNSLDYFYPILAALYLGVIITNFNPNYAAGELQHTAELSKPKIIFCTPATLNTFEQVKNKLSFKPEILLMETNEQLEGYKTLEYFISMNSSKDFDVTKFKPVQIDSDEQVAFILYSSGTTGLPKGVMLTHTNVSIVITHRRDPRFYTQTEPQTGHFLILLPFYHAYGLFTTLCNLIHGSLIIMIRKFEENLFLKTIQDYRISSLSLVPPLVVYLSKSPLVTQYELSCLEEIGCGAAPLSKEQEDAAIRRLKLHRIEQGYGMTETSLAVTKLPTNENRQGSCGKVLPYTSAKVVDVNSGEPLGPNQKGELCFKGGLIMKGYLNDKEATKRTISDDGWLSTGDIGYYDEDGFFYIVDRLKELIKYKGSQVPPAELEAILLTHPKIKDAGVIGVPDEFSGELPLAFVVQQPGQSLTEKEVQEFVAKQVSPHKRLRGGVRFLNEIPRIPSGKILRRKLRELVAMKKSKL